MGDVESNRRSLLMAAPLLWAAIAAGDKAGNTGDIKLAPPPETGPDPRKPSSSHTTKSTSSRGATCLHTVAKWRNCMAISTSRGRIWC